MVATLMFDGRWVGKEQKEVEFKYQKKWEGPCSRGSNSEWEDTSRHLVKAIPSHSFQGRSRDEDEGEKV